METRQTAETKMDAQRRVDNAIASGATLKDPPHSRDEAGFSMKARLYVYVHARRTGAVPGGPIDPGRPSDCADAIIASHAAGRKWATNELQIAFFVNHSIHMPESATGTDGIPSPFNAAGSESPLHTLTGDVGKWACARFITPDGYVIRNIADAIPKGTGGHPRKYRVTEELVHLGNESPADTEKSHEAAIAEIRSDPTLSDTEKEQLVKARRGQGQFRQELISLWENKCCLTGCDAIEVLKASHIKPWSQSDNRERLDKFNGFLLTPNADTLFDQGYISFSDDGVMQVSPRLSDEARNVLLAECRRKIEIFDENKPYLDFHRSRRFQR